MTPDKCTAENPRCVCHPPLGEPCCCGGETPLVSGGKCGGTPEETTGAASAFGWCLVGGLFVLVIFAAGMAFAWWGLDGGGAR